MKEYKGKYTIILDDSLPSSKIIEDKVEELQNCASYPEGSVFTNNNSKHGLDIYCSVCRLDKYSVLGFEYKTSSRVYDVVKGKLSCRCSKQSKLPVSILRYKALNEVRLKNFKPITDLGTVKLKSDKVKWVYEKHQICFETPLHILLKNKNCCTVCMQEHKENLSFRINKDRLSDPDSLYIIRLTDEEESFIKIGRTFLPKERFNYYKNRGYSLEFIDYYIASHEDICRLEVMVGKSLKDYQYTPIKTFNGSKRECYSNKILKLVTED